MAQRVWNPSSPCSPAFALRYRLRRLLSWVVIIVGGLLACSYMPAPIGLPLVAQSSVTATAGEVLEQPVIEIPIGGAVSRNRAELSGMAWYGDMLILLPQYPASIERHLFTLPKQAIVDALQNPNAKPLRAGVVRLIGAEALEELEGFEGFEAIAFDGDRAYLTVETMRNKAMVGYVVTGVMTPDLSGLRLYPTVRTEVAAQTAITNMSEEALFIAGDRVITLYEGNGQLINPHPIAHVFDAMDLSPLDPLPMAHLDFRITDATPLDDDNRFWALNTFYPGDLLKFGPDPLAIKYGMGPTHRRHSAVERLVQMELTPDGVILVDRPPIQLQLADGRGRNWEGIVRLETPALAGFLMVTDKRPRTILAFVADP